MRAQCRDFGEKYKPSTKKTLRSVSEINEFSLCLILYIITINGLFSLFSKGPEPLPDDHQLAKTRYILGRILQQQLNDYHTHSPLTRSHVRIIPLFELITQKSFYIRIHNWENVIPFENVWIKINTENGRKIFIIFIYLKSGFKTQDLKTYVDHISDVIISREPNAEFIIMGDFNMSCILWESLGEYCEAIDYEGNCAQELLNMLNLTNIFQRNNIKNRYNKSLNFVISNVNVSVNRAVDLLLYEDG